MVELDKHGKELMNVLEEEEQEEAKMFDELVGISKEKVQFRIKSRADPSKYVIVRTRKLKQSEISEYRHSLYKINKKLLGADALDQVPLTPTQSDQVDKLIGDYIRKAMIVHPKNKENLDIVLQDPDMRIRLFEGIMEVSTPDNADLERLEKFRPDK